MSMGVPLTGRDELHLAMGEFLSECSNLENLLITLMMFCQNKKHFEEVYLETLDKTFGARIKEFKRACSHYAFTPDQRATIDAAIVGLDDLLPRRNLIVHGITYEVGFAGSEPKAYRIGIPRGNIDYMNQFLRDGADVEHSFPVERVRQAIADCKALASILGPITAHLVKMLADSQNH
jgi:hypothetical protein